MSISGFKDQFLFYGFISHCIYYLKDKGYPDVECIKGGTFSNRRATEENWIFSKKALDKPAEKVILSKEKKAAPKNKSKAKKKDK